MRNPGPVSQTRRERQTDAIAEAKQKLFPPLRNRILAQAAEALSGERPDIAEPLVAKVLQANARNPDALNLLADIRRRQNRFDEAERLVAQCVELSPRSAGFRYNYAVILRRLDRFDDALARIEELLKDEPQNPLFREQRAVLLAHLGRHAEALDCRRTLAEENRGSAELWLEYAHSLRGLGSGADCVAAYHHALALSPSSISIYLHLANLKTYRFSAQEILEMESLIARHGLSATERGDLHFALGKAFGDEARYAKSFEHYAKGNALRRIGAEYDCEAIATHRQNCEQGFTREYFSSRTGWGSRATGPIFIVGMPRSGSTLVEQILSSHTAVEGLGELPNLDTVVGKRLSAFAPDLPAHELRIGGRFEFRRGLLEILARAIEQTDAQHFRNMGEEYLELTSQQRASKSPYFSDKGLRNFGHIGWICVALPNAKIVDARRHPLDCGWSCFRSHFPGGQAFGHRLSDIGHVYANYARLMGHFDRVLPGRIHRVIYEDLVAEPEAEIRRLFAYLELPFEDECLRFHENKRAVKTLSSEQVRTPLYQEGVGQWKPYEGYLGPLKLSLGTVLANYRQP